MVFNRGMYFHSFVAAVVAEFLACEFVRCQTDHTTLPTEATDVGLPQSVFLTLISVIGSLLGLVCLGITALLCFYFKRTRKGKTSLLQKDRSKTVEDLPTRALHTKPPVIGSSVHDVSRVVELVKSKCDKTDMAGVSPERSFATLVDIPVLNPEVQRIGVDDVPVEESKVTYMANYHRRFTDVTGDDDATSAIIVFEPTSENPVFGSPVDTFNPEPTSEDPVFGSPVDTFNPEPTSKDPVFESPVDTNNSDYT